MKCAQGSTLDFLVRDAKTSLWLLVDSAMSAKAIYSASQMLQVSIFDLHEGSSIKHGHMKYMNMG